jgi:hypothetical protein
MFHFLKKKTSKQVCYQMPRGWEVTFPVDWKFEENDDQFIYYPQDSDLTVRMSVLTVIHPETRALAPVELFRSVFQKGYEETENAKMLALDEFAKDAKFYFIQGYEYTYTEDDELVYCFYVECYTEGTELLITIHSSSRDECFRGLSYLKTVKKYESD